MDEDALICDLAETYQIYDYRQLPANLVAVFAYGLRENSRIKLAMTEQKLPFEQYLLAGVFDRLGLLIWAKTEDGLNGRNRPESVVELLTSGSKKEKSGSLVFSSGEEFEKAKEELLKQLGGES